MLKSNHAGDGIEMKKSDLLFNFNLLKLNQYFIPSKEWVFYLYCPQNNYR